MDEAITYRTREFLNELSEIKFADREYNYSLIRVVGDLLLKAKNVIAYEWPELTFVKVGDLDTCGYECARKYPKTAGLLAMMIETPYPRNPKAFPYYRKKLGVFRDMARQALTEWKQGE